MTALSPLTRRIVAVGLLVLALLLAIQLIVVPLALAIGDRRDELAGLREREAGLTAIRHRLLPDGSTMPAGLTIRAPDRLTADRRLRAFIVGSAAVAGIPVILSASTALPESGAELGVRLTATGPEPAVMAFATLVEHGTPLIRFRAWRLQADPRPTPRLTLTAIAAASWEQGR